MRASRGKIAKASLALGYCLARPVLLRKVLAGLYNERIVAASRIPTVSVESLVGVVPEVRLVDFVPEHGNVTPLELLCICAMLKAFKPAFVLELGTYNGNTTLQMAANVGSGAIVSTVDLPIGASAHAANDPHDAALICADVRERPRYVGSQYQSLIRQFYGNSLEIDFSSLSPNAPEFIFIDAGHSDECVRNDTLKSLDVLAPGGTIVWHDYTQDWPDVFNYLNELAITHSLQHLRGTNLVVYRSADE